MWIHFLSGRSTAKRIVPPYDNFLSFIDMRPQATEISFLPSKKSFVPPPKIPHTKVASGVGNTNSDKCVVCKIERHPLYVCAKFKVMSQDNNH